MKKYTSTIKVAPSEGRLSSSNNSPNFAGYRKMKIASALLTSSIFFGMAVGAAHAETCLRLNPFVDVIRLQQTVFVDEAVEGSHRLVNGNWTANNRYSLPVVGSLEVTVPRTTPPSLRLGIHGTQHTVAFGGHSDCTLDGVLGSGWSLSCDGKVAGIFNNSGSPLSVISCDTLSTAPETVGRAAGQ